MTAPDDQAPERFDLQRPEAPRGTRWMVRGDDGRSAEPTTEVRHGAGDAFQGAVEELKTRFARCPGARVELHTERRCGHLHLRMVLVQDHDGEWEPFLSPYSAPVLLRADGGVPALSGAPAITAKGGDA